MREKPRTNVKDRLLKPVKLMDKVKADTPCLVLDISKMVDDRHCHLSDTKLPRVTTKDSTRSRKGAWYTRRAMDKWVTTPTIPIRRTDNKGRFINKDSTRRFVDAMRSEMFVWANSDFERPAAGN